MTLRHDTGEDARNSDRREPRLALACVGSPEDDFADAGRMFALEGVSRVIFNRSEAGDRIDAVGLADAMRLDIPIAYVSARHAELLIGPPQSEHGHRLIDHDSRNGTHVGGVAVRGEVPVVPGDIFEIGRSFWTLVDLPAHDDGAAVDRIDPEGAINPRMRTLLAALGRVADSTLPLLLTGETGVGKDRLALAIHRARGGQGEFVHANVMTATIEQLLFGSATEPGPIQRAFGGTLYLDDIGELDADAQTKLQSALMSHAPSGTAEPSPNDVRVIGASTRDLRSMVSLEGFRPDLMARLAGFEGYVPPLRERREDLGLLVRTMARRSDGTPVRVATSVFRAMLAHAWPFNVRELQHAVTAAVSMAGSSDDGITIEIWEAVGGHPQGEVRDPARIQAVREALVQHLVAHNGDTQRVAESMHCGLADIERWLDRLSLRPEHYGRAG